MSDMYNLKLGREKAGRRKWDVKGDVADEEETSKQDVRNPSYVEYLMHLQDRNRMLKQLRKKDEQQIELERKEQGFSVYVNGANNRGRVGGAVTTRSGGSKRSSKTAGSARQNVGDTSSETVTVTSNLRAKSAPVRRQGWNPESLEIITQRGERVQVNAPDLLTGNYEADFEAASTSFTEGQMLQVLGQNARQTQRYHSDESDDSEVDELAVSLEDVPELRRSLEAAGGIAECIDTEESDVSSSASLSSAEEVDEEVSESTGMTRDTTVSSSADFSSTRDQDVVVLSFASNKHGRVDRQVTSAKRKTSDATAGNTFDRKEHVQQLQQTRSKPQSRQGSATSGVLNTFGQPSGVSTYRQQMSKGLDSVPGSDEIREALEATANETEVAKRKGAFTAPVIQWAPALSASPTQRPLSIPVASPLTQKTLEAVTEKVKHMSDSQQRRLLKVLGRLDQSSQSESSCEVTQTKSQSEQKQSAKSESNAAIVSVQQPSSEHQQLVTKSVSTTVTEPTLSNDRQEGTIQQEISPRRKDVGDEILGSMAELSGVEVHVEILSNWGHPNMIGLTEVQFFDSEGKRMWLGSNRVQLLGAPEGVDPGNVGALVNGKTKTVKSHFMWTCPYSRGQRLDLVFIVPVEFSVTSTTLHAYQYGISKIKIWNYNGRMNELNAGVREARVFFGGELIWKGLVNKGCGNQAFEYCTVIDMEIRDETETQEYEHTVRSQTVILDRAIAVQPESKTEEKHPDSPGGVKSERTASPSNSSSQLKEHKSVVNSASEASQVSVTQQLVREKPLSLKPAEMASRQSNSRTATACGKETPLWLRDSLNGQHSASQPYLLTVGLTEEGKSQRSIDCGNADDPLGLGKPFPRSASETRLEADLSYSETRQSHTHAGRRAIGKQMLNEETKRRSFSDSQLFPDESNYETELQKSKDPFLSSTSATDTAPTHIRSQGEKTKRARWQPRASLEKSLQSLEQFRKSDYGRITAGMNMSGDTLDVFMSQTIDEGMLLQDSSVTNTTESREYEQFAIPELPTGRTLTINILTTWGDRHYVGLNGIEIFTMSGHLVEVEEISADPADINVYPEYDSDPRVVQNLLDGVNRTRDDLHMWLAPFTAGQKHIVCIEFFKAETIAMIRVWNYNKSRIHSYRGARHMQMMLDDHLIFDGEIARACGGLLGGSEAFGDTILFTTDEDILSAVSEFDETYHGEMENVNDYYYEDELQKIRPGTVDRDEEQNVSRPFTSIRTQADDKDVPVSLSQFPQGRRLQLSFLTTWGDQYYLGLTGIEVLGCDGLPITLSEEQLQATPRDLNDLPDYGDDCRVLENLIDGVNVTMSDEHMWMVPFSEGENHLLVIDLRTEMEVSGLRIWNYNKSPDDTFRGAQSVSISLDGQLVSSESSFLLRKGPGNTHFDFGQKIMFNDLPEIAEKIDNHPSTSIPIGFVFQFQLISTWGDPYYIGLNGLEVFDILGHRLSLTTKNIDAFPQSVNDLEVVSGDVRTPDKLIDGVNDTYDGRHMWLAPVFQQQVNLLYVYFDHPVSVSMIKLWNYSKTPSRGVKEFSVLVDGLLVYHGILPSVPLEARGILPTCMAPVDHHSILFTEGQDIVAKEERHALRSVFEDQDFQMTNDSYVCTGGRQSKSVHSVDPALRPQTSVTAGSFQWS
ncbi:katanin-interacting protein-like isoform X2 [Corticium candelabrum]|uniref:katanin-interacting protein-like isoform X2 n=1 Tax=Corticium candelabrum TaxID=121492 RepID=UPI002E313A5B|nr:katanin-interacting protein-like isoform X2 [Corticium candelabrum]